MPEQSRREQELARIMDALADSIDDVSGPDLLAETTVEGDDPSEMARDTRTVLLGAVQAVRKQRLADARSRYEQRVQDMATAAHGLPETAAEQLSLLKSVFASRPELVTLQFRDLDKVEPEDVESLLRQLAELGVLNEPRQEKDDG